MIPPIRSNPKSIAARLASSPLLKRILLKAQTKSQTSESGSKKAAGTQQAAASSQAAVLTNHPAPRTPVPEPDENYDFAVTDMSDVYLDPKPQLAFGKHEPHLVW